MGCVCETFQDPANEQAWTGRYNGKVCMEPVRKNKYLADWTRSMDKWGWSTCKKGFMLTGLKRDGWEMLCTTLHMECASSLLRAPGLPQLIPTNECYHENWWKKFDSKGGKFCRRG